MIFRSVVALLLLGSFFSSTVDPDEAPASWTTDGKGAVHLLYRDYKQKTGRDFEAMSQGKAPSCVGCAIAKGYEIMHGVPFSPEWAYAASREGKKTVGPGSFAGWAADASKEIGMLPAATYSAIGEDFRVYSAALANQYGRRGPPEHLNPIAGLYKSPGYYKIRSWEELRGAIANGHAVIFGSNISFGPRYGQVKARNGTLRQRWWGKWNHSMVFIGLDDREDKGALVMNSWGENWVSGPKRFKGEPDGCFWVTKSSAVDIINQGDTYALRPITSL